MERREFLGGLMASAVNPRLVAAGLPDRRFLLDEEFSWLDRAAADRFVGMARQAGFNILVPCVWHGRGVSWSSDLPREPRWDRNRRPLRDPFEYLVRRAHDEGMEVHPWFTVVLRQRDFFPSYRDEGTPEKAFDVHNPRFGAFIQEVILEVVRNYPVDGINLDYVRAMGICQSAACQSDYRRLTGRSLLADARLHRMSADARQAIEQWNGRAVTYLVRSLSAAARRERPGLLVSVSSHAAHKPLRLQGTDSVAWANSGLVDLVMHMEYRQASQMRYQLLREAVDSLDDPEKLVMIVGNYERSETDRSKVWPREAGAVVEALDVGMSFNPAGKGIALYEYRFLDDAQVAQIARTLGPAPSLRIRKAD